MGKTHLSTSQRPVYQPFALRYHTLRPDAQGRLRSSGLTKSLRGAECPGRNEVIALKSEYLFGATTRLATHKTQ